MPTALGGGARIRNRGDNLFLSPELKGKRESVSQTGPKNGESSRNSNRLSVGQLDMENGPQLYRYNVF